MATIVFYEKPGCGTNARQKRMLEAAGHDVDARSLLTEPWTAERLRSYFGKSPIASWFNSVAPRIKSGEINPGMLKAEQALAAMVADPLLIRRPLIEAEGRKFAGFDGEPARLLLGRDDDEGEGGDFSVEGCSRPDQSTPCPEPGAVERPLPS